MAEKSYKKTSRCWPGFEPMPGKSEHEEGSCRKKAPSKNGGKQVNRETARKKQIAAGGERARQAKGKSPSAAERRTVSKTAQKKAASKKTSSHKSAAKKTAGKSATKKSAAKKTVTKKTATKKARAAA